MPKLPPALDGNFDVDNWFKVYVNGLFIPAEKYSYYVSSSANQVEFNFSTGSSSIIYSIKIRNFIL